MDETLKAILHPELVPWMITAAILLFLLKFTSKQAESWLSERMTPPAIAHVEAFVLLLHIGAGVIAAVYCYFFTTLPPPGIGPDVRSVFGPEILRLTGYLICLMPCLFAAMGLSIRGASHNLAEPFPYLRHGARLFFIGVPAAWLVVGYAAIVNPAILQGRPIPEAGPEIALWWYSWVALLSLTTGLMIYVPLLLLQWLWKQAARIP